MAWSHGDKATKEGSDWLGREASKASQMYSFKRMYNPSLFYNFFCIRHRAKLISSIESSISLDDADALVVGGADGGAGHVVDGVVDAAGRVVQGVLHVVLRVPLPDSCPWFKMSWLITLRTFCFR